MSQQLDARIETLGRTAPFTPQELAGLSEFVRTAPDEALFRINPLGYAAERGMPEARAIDLFVHASRAGIFDLAWEVLCYGCGGYLQSGHALGELSAQTHCAVCDMDIEATLDDAVEVSFTVAPLIRPIRFHAPDELVGLDLLRLVFSGNRLRASEFDASLEAARVLLEFLPPAGDKAIELDLAPGLYRLVTASHHAHLYLNVAEGTSAVDVEVHDRALLAPTTELAAGGVSLRLVNATERPATFAMVAIAALPELPTGCEAYRGFRPFLTGKRILTSQAFRDLYRNHSMAPGSSFSLRSLTFLFTDLKDSTQLYDRIGDLSAYDLVQEHFKILSETVARHEGAIVKTIGDAIMATFPRPASAVEAAAEMNRRLAEWNRTRHEADLALKIGIHEGACIAVSSNDRIDYFGQTVNQAARIQALAGAGEIFLSEAVYSSQGVPQMGDVSFLEPQVVQLKGISEKVTVYPAVVSGGVLAS